MHRQVLQMKCEGTGDRNLEKLQGALRKVTVVLLNNEKVLNYKKWVCSVRHGECFGGTGCSLAPMNLTGSWRVVIHCDIIGQRTMWTRMRSFRGNNLKPEAPAQSTSRMWCGHRLANCMEKNSHRILQKHRDNMECTVYNIKLGPCLSNFEELQ